MPASSGFNAAARANAVNRLVGVAQHAIGAAELQPAIKVARCLLQVGGKLRHHALDHLRALRVRHLGGARHLVLGRTGLRSGRLGLRCQRRAFRQGGRLDTAVLGGIGNATRDGLAHRRVLGKIGRKSQPAIDRPLVLAGLRVGDRQVVAGRLILRIGGQHRGERLVRRGRHDAAGRQHLHLAIAGQHVWRRSGPGRQRGDRPPSPSASRPASTRSAPAAPIRRIRRIGLQLLLQLLRRLVHVACVGRAPPGLPVGRTAR